MTKMIGRNEIICPYCEKGYEMRSCTVFGEHWEQCENIECGREFRAEAEDMEITWASWIDYPKGEYRLFGDEYASEDVWIRGLIASGTKEHCLEKMEECSEYRNMEIVRENPWVTQGLDVPKDLE